MLKQKHLCLFVGLLLLGQFGDLGSAARLWAEPPQNNPTKVHPTLLRRLEETTEGKPVKAWVLFTDKDITTEQDRHKALGKLRSAYHPRAIQRRLNRRSRPGLFDEQDLPVPDRYLGKVAATGVELRIVSKWVNGVSVMGTRRQFEQIAELPFVKILQPVRRGRKILPERSTSSRPTSPQPAPQAREHSEVFMASPKSNLLR